MAKITKTAKKTVVAYDCEKCGETTATVSKVETERHKDAKGNVIKSIVNDVKFCDTCGIADW